VVGTADDGCDSAIVTVYLNGWPTAVDDNATTSEDVSVEIFALANDSDPTPPWRTGG